MSTKIGFTRSHAQQLIKELYEDSFDGEEIEVDPETMTNEELCAELCLSGIIHDEDMAGVFDTIPSNVKNAEKFL